MGLEGFDVRKVVEKSSTKTTVNDLAKRGIHSVRLIDEALIHKLIHQAVERIVISRANLLTADEREKIYKEARHELGRLVSEQQQMAERVENAKQDKETLLRQLDNMREQVKLITTMADEEARKRFNEGIATQAPLIQSQRDRVKDLEKQLGEARTGQNAGPRMEDVVALIRDMLDAHGRAGASDEVLASLRDSMQTRDATMARELEKAFSKSMNTVSKKIEAIRVKVGGGTEVEVRPGDATLGSILNQNIESNLDVVGVKRQTAPQVDSAVDRLRKMRQGGS